MNRTAALFAVVALVVVGLAAPATGTALDGHVAGDQATQAAETTAEGASDGTAEPPAPGARLAGVVDVQEAEVEGDLEGRSFGIQVARADSDASRAAIVRERVTDLSRRTEELRERKRALEAARANGAVSHARFSAEMAALAARVGAVEHQLNRTAAVSSRLPADSLVSQGIDVDAIETIRNDARDLSGPDVAAIARSIAGSDVGGGLADAGNRTVGGPGGGTGDGAGGPGTASPADPDAETESDPGEPGTPPDESGTPTDPVGPVLPTEVPGTIAITTTAVPTIVGTDANDGDESDSDGSGNDDGILPG